MAETNFLIPDNSNGNIPVGALPFLNGNNNGLFGGNGWGGGILGFFLGLLCGNGGFGNGFFGGGNNGNTVDLLMQAINNNGNRNNDAVQQLATTLGQDFNLVNNAINTLQQGIFQVSAAQGLNYAQTVNAIQSGNNAITSQLQQCCCNMQNVSNQNTQAILGELRAMQTQCLQDKLDAERDRNTRLAGENSQLLQNQNFANMLANATNPLAMQLQGIRNEVDAIKRCQPQTITLPNNSMTAVPTIWANAVADNIVDRISAALTPATDTTTPANA